MLLHDISRNTLFQVKIYRSYFILNQYILPKLVIKMRSLVFGLITLAVFTTAFAGRVYLEMSSSEERSVNDTIELYRRQISELMIIRLESIAYNVCDLRQSFPNFKEPVSETIKRLEATNIYSETVCKLFTENFEYIVEPITTEFDTCFSSEDSKVASYVAKAIVSATKYICQINGEHIFEFINPCIPKIDIRPCLHEETDWLDITKTFEQTVCKKYGEMKDCVEEAIERKCKVEMTRSSLMGLLDSIFETPCSVDGEIATNMIRKTQK